MKANSLNPLAEIDVDSVAHLMLRCGHVDLSLEIVKDQK